MRRRRNRVYSANIDEIQATFARRCHMRAFERVLRRGGRMDVTGMTTLNGVDRG